MKDGGYGGAHSACRGVVEGKMRPVEGSQCGWEFPALLQFLIVSLRVIGRLQTIMSGRELIGRIAKQIEGRLVNGAAVQSSL